MSSASKVLKASAARITAARYEALVDGARDAMAPGSDDSLVERARLANNLAVLYAGLGRHEEAGKLRAEATAIGLRKSSG